MATEFELEFKGSTKELLDAISILAEHNINLDTVATAKVDDRYVVKFLTGSEEEVRRMLVKADLHFRDRQVQVVKVFNNQVSGSESPERSWRTASRSTHRTSWDRRPTP